MGKRKTIFIIPGFRHKPTHKAYRKLAKRLKAEGYDPVLMAIPWKQTTISENTKYFLRKYARFRSKEKYILGFSFGAMIAFLASTKVRTSGLILCSLSPYFREDVSKVKIGGDQNLTVRRYQDFLNLPCSTLAKQIKAKRVMMLYGCREARSLKKRTTEAFGQISTVHKSLYSVRETEHNLGDRRYLQAIYHVARVLISN